MGRTDRADAGQAGLQRPVDGADAAARGRDPPCRPRRRATPRPTGLPPSRSWFSTRCASATARRPSACGPTTSAADLGVRRGRAVHHGHRRRPHDLAWWLTGRGAGGRSRRPRRPAGGGGMVTLHRRRDARAVRPRPAQARLRDDHQGGRRPEDVQQLLPPALRGDRRAGADRRGVRRPDPAVADRRPLADRGRHHPPALGPPPRARRGRGRDRRRRWSRASPTPRHHGADRRRGRPDRRATATGSPSARATSP